LWRRKGEYLQGDARTLTPPPLVGDDVVWLKGNAYEKTAPTPFIHRERISRISAMEPQHRSG